MTSQRDFVGILGFSHPIGKLSVGFSGKYLSSELIETATARAYAADAGLSYPVFSRLRVGAVLSDDAGRVGPLGNSS